MRKKDFLIIVFLLNFSINYGQELHDKIKVKIIEYGIHDDGGLNIVQFNQYIDFTKPMSMTYTGAAAGTNSIETTGTTWHLKDNDGDGFPDGIGFDQIQTFTDDVNGGGGSPDYIDFTMTGFKEFDKNVFCNGFLIFHVANGDAEAYYKLQFEPLLTIIQPPVQNDIGCNDVSINVNEISKGYHSNSYVWKYYLEGGSWTNFPDSYQGNSSLTLNSSFFNDYLGKVSIQVSSCSQESESVIYTVISCSPDFKELVTNPLSCNYNDDGSFELKLGRDLYSTEKLAIIIYEKNTISGNYDIIKDQNLNITSLEKISATSYKHQWSSSLPNGTFKLKYQTGENINSNDISWSSLIPVEFTIAEIAPVSFSITNTSDKTCFEVNDGYIDVSAIGEGVRTFLYQLTKDGVVQIFNGTNWVNYTGTNIDSETWYNFTNAETTRISNLAKGKYRVKVRDSQGCFARKN